ncbi:MULTISPECIES: phosphate ABC transporter permease PstA [Janibacter]|uniref:Phosphate transport system permease protein PstA n=1 Tax=Janibacter hoylei PVAS-1 TaxID=1210046 RepID=K1DXS4_9MICO|nr:phosphate ABC transporter permease PstA [Janibacter hoylei]EKA61189.1 phosphate transport system permease PstA [Janibacter hoylei PVAS-1]MCT1617835.1 phosphate ABC transporter permease PstA [Janibacter hoylei]MCT2293812.1 phosphate ABC transporter permease PstA [Janibacter hoylei]MCW4602024.1 phosphate ABC transporter permease PstA [Janibacter hoylei]RWU82722.1 phosphate ABC transporter, permease protein PstA [Janibacter hoylei PVAS-1]
MTATTHDDVQADGRLEQPVRWAILAGAGVAAVALLAVVGGLSPLTVILVGALFYCIAIYVASRSVEGSRHAMDRLVTGVVTTTFLLAMVPLVSVLWTIISKGLDRFDVEFFTYSMRGVTTGETGGAYHAIMGTVITTGIATLISVPIGLFAAIYLVEYGNKGPLARGLTFFVDVMTGIPSIVAGLFAIGFFTMMLGDESYQSGIVGAVALSVLMIPTVVRSSEEMLRLVPNELREASYALGVSKWLTIVKVVLPTAVAGLATGVTLAIARVMGETAPLLITMGAAKAVNFNPFEGSMSALPLFAYSSYANPGTNKDDSIAAAWTAALVLMVIVMVLNIVARLISKFFAPKTGR